MLVLAGLGVAAAFAPAWDSFTLRTAAGQTQLLTLGDAFSGSTPGLVITGDVLVMLAVAVTVVLAAFWRPVRHGGVLLAGAAIPMAAQAISALVQAGAARLARPVRDLERAGHAARPHDQLRRHAGVLDLLRVPRRAARIVRVDALHAAAGVPGRAGPVG